MSQGKSLRLKLRVNAPEMAARPWEFLHDPCRAEYMCLSQETPIVRYLEPPQPIQPLAVTPPLRILGMVASPSDAGDLNVDVEKQRMETALHALQSRRPGGTDLAGRRHLAHLAAGDAARAMARLSLHRAR